ncbi:hypothetical protein PSYPI_38142, partial [Pseudomonas syringae pv. pisi str. 1704B]
GGLQAGVASFDCDIGWEREAGPVIDDIPDIVPDNNIFRVPCFDNDLLVDTHSDRFTKLVCCQRRMLDSDAVPIDKNRITCSHIFVSVEGNAYPFR